MFYQTAFQIFLTPVSESAVSRKTVVWSLYSYRLQIYRKRLLWTVKPKQSESLHLKTMPITTTASTSTHPALKRAHGQTHQGLTKSPWSGMYEAVWRASSCMNTFPLWWRHTAADAKANSRPRLNCCWHPHRLLLRLLLLLCFILLLHLLTLSSLLLHVAQCSVQDEASSHVGISPNSGSRLKSACWWGRAVCIGTALSEAANRSLVGSKKCFSPCSLEDWRSFTHLSLPVELLKLCRKSEELQILPLSMILLNLSSSQDYLQSKRSWVLLLISSSEDQEPFPVIHPSMKKVWTGPTRHLNCSVTWTLTLNSCCIHHLRKRSDCSGAIRHYTTMLEKLVRIKAPRT